MLFVMHTADPLLNPQDRVSVQGDADKARQNTPPHKTTTTTTTKANKHSRPTPIHPPSSTDWQGLHDQYGSPVFVTAPSASRMQPGPTTVTTNNPSTAEPDSPRSSNESTTSSESSFGTFGPMPGVGGQTPDRPPPRRAGDLKGLARLWKQAAERMRGFKINKGSNDAAQAGAHHHNSVINPRKVRTCPLPTISTHLRGG